MVNAEKKAARRATWALKSANGGKLPVAQKSRFYPADDVSTPKLRNFIAKPTKLRASITPGTVLILLAGRHKGKRVVFLKQLDSGLLLVTGPYKVNGVPARRVNQRYVIATSTKIELPSLSLDKYSDSYFKAAEAKDKKKSEEGFFNDETAEKKELDATYVKNQAELDAALGKAVTGDLEAYLKSRFSLKDGDRPHLMKF